MAAVFLGILSGILAMWVVDFKVVGDGVIAIFLSLFGLLGIWLSTKDTNAAVLEYIAGGMGVFLAVGFDGIGATLFFIIAAIYTLKEENVSCDCKINKWIIPVASLVIAIILGIISQLYFV
ncbi:MAG: hypothetical protein ACRC1M_04625 [Methanobacteriaceae archaeon]